MHTPTIPSFDLPLTADSGQCFRFVRESDGFRVIASGRVLRMSRAGGDLYEVDCSPHEWDAFWRDYFDSKGKTLISFIKRRNERSKVFFKEY